MLITIIQRYSSLVNRIQSFKGRYLVTVTHLFSFLPNYYRLNDLMWQDGLLIDFLQKKVADKWIRRFLVYSSYLFSERVLFKFVVRFYIDFVVWPMTFKGIFEVSNIALLLSFTLVSFIGLLLLMNLNLLYLTFL